MRQETRGSREPPKEGWGAAATSVGALHGHICGEADEGQHDAKAPASSAPSCGDEPSCAAAHRDLDIRLARAQQMERIRFFEAESAAYFRSISLDRLAGIAPWIGLTLVAAYLLALGVIIIVQFAGGEGPSRALLGTFATSMSTSGVGLGVFSISRTKSRSNQT